MSQLCPPRCLSFLLCESVSPHPERGKLDIMGMHVSLRAERLPVRHPTLQLLAQVTEIHEPLTLRLRCEHMEHDDVPIDIELTAKADTPQQIIGLYIDQKGATFKHEGMYSFALSWRDELIGSAALRVVAGDG